MVDAKKSHRYLLVGASSDLGLAFIDHVVRPGDFIMAHAYSQQKKLRAVLQQKEVAHITLAADLTQADDTNRFAQSILEVDQPFDKIVFFASPPAEAKHFRQLATADFQRHFAIQVLAPAELLQAALPRMARGSGGRVVFVLSSMIEAPTPLALAPYVTAKHAALGLMKSLAVEYGPKGINFNSVSPSMVETNFLRSVDPRVVALIAEQHPLRRNAIVGDVIPAIEFLLGVGSSYINGANIFVTGGKNC